MPRFEYVFAGITKTKSGKTLVEAKKAKVLTLREKWLPVASVFSLVTIIAVTGILSFLSCALHWDREMAEVRAEQARLTAQKLAFEQREIACFAITLFWEGERGKLVDEAAIAQSILERTVSGDYPSTICGVVNEVRISARSGKRVAMYSYIFDNRPHPETQNPKRHWNLTQEMAAAIYYDWQQNGRDYGVYADTRRRAEGSTHFHAPYVTPDWSVEDVRDCKLKPLGLVSEHYHYAPARYHPEWQAACRAQLRVAQAKNGPAKAKKPVKVSSR